MRAFILSVIYLLLFSGFWLLFYEIRIFRRFLELAKRTAADLDSAARQRTLEGRKQLLKLQNRHTFLVWMERQLQYSGLKNRFPRLGVEWWIAGNMVLFAALFPLLCFAAGFWQGAAASAFLMLGEAFVLKALRSINLRRVGSNLMKLLDFLGNYSVTAAEATGVFSQVSRYMDEPLRSALDQCCHEARTTGDSGLALLSMAEKIEHPKFKELARNMEISIRHCADFSALVKSSRKSLREYMRISQERRVMLREAAVNMALLLVMSAAVLFTVGSLTGISVAKLVTGTVPGKIGICGMLLIFCLFAAQMYRAQS